MHTLTKNLHRSRHGKEEKEMLDAFWQGFTLMGVVAILLTLAKRGLTSRKLRSKTGSRLFKIAAFVSPNKRGKK